jgi:death-on-curing family protein
VTWLKKWNMSDIFESVDPHKFSDYIRYLNQIVGESGSTVSGDALYSAVVSSDYYSTITLKISSIVRSLIKNHPFVDGNKRTALLFFLLMCREGDIKVRHSKSLLLKIFVDIAANNYTVDQIETLLFT